MRERGLWSLVGLGVLCSGCLTVPELERETPGLAESKDGDADDGVDTDDGMDTDGGAPANPGGPSGPSDTGTTESSGDADDGDTDSTGPASDGDDTGGSPPSACDLDPGACPAPSCGDGARNGDEVCDAADFGGETCGSIDPSFAGGVLACSEDCTGISTAACELPECGDGVREGQETCDGDDAGFASCSSQGFDAGDLGCAEACDALDTSACLICVQVGESCAGDPDGCCPGTTCNDFGADVFLCL